MSRPANRNAPIIILRRVTVASAGHHGGAWKVAYADFVTAMMAFFLLMWLLNATTEKQRAGLADYFDPTVVQSRTGGAAAFDGVERPATPALEVKDSRGFDELARDIATRLSGEGAESMQQRNLLRHVVTRITDEGLVIELGDLAGAPLFERDTAGPTPALRELSVIVARVLAHVGNEIAFTGHVHAFPEVLIRSPAWELSDARAHAVRRLVEDGGLGHRRTQRVTAFGDRKARPGDPMAPENNRIQLIVLR